jgi:hypothetical protein
MRVVRMSVGAVGRDEVLKLPGDGMKTLDGGREP